MRFAQASAVAGGLDAPWSDLLAAFEEHGRGDVGLLKLEPDARAGLVRVTAPVHNNLPCLSVCALEADPRLDRVVPTNHQIERDTPGMPLHFTMIELVIVMAMLGLLLSLALPQYMAPLERGREQVLQPHLATMHEAIDKFRGDTGN